MKLPGRPDIVFPKYKVAFSAMGISGMDTNSRNERQADANLAHKNTRKYRTG